MKKNLLFLSSLFCSLSLARINWPYHTYQQQCLNFVKNTAEWVNCYKNTFNLGNYLTQEQFLNAWRHFNVDCSSGFYNRNRALRSAQRPGLQGFICADEITANIKISSGQVFRPGNLINNIDYMGPLNQDHLRTN